MLDPETRMVATTTSHRFRPGPLADLPAKVPGRHRWILGTAYTVTDEEARTAHDGTRTVLMGAANLISFTIGCWDCEQAYIQCVSEPCLGDPAEGAS